MQITRRIAAAVLAAGLLAAPAITIAQGPPPRGGWDAPPSNFRQEVQQQGFRDGLNGAQKDLENRRRPNVMNRDEYRNYRGPNARAYRAAFQQGYQTFWRHQGGPGRRY
jgi:hypothetical protein